MIIEFKSWISTNQSIERVYISVDDQTAGYVERNSGRDTMVDGDFSHTISDELFETLTLIMDADYTEFYGERAREASELDIFNMFNMAGRKPFSKNCWTKKFHTEYKNGIEI